MNIFSKKKIKWKIDYSFANLYNVWLNGFSYLLLNSVDCNITYRVASGKRHHTLERMIVEKTDNILVLL